MKIKGSPKTLSNEPRPFMKWAGGKGSLLPEFIARLPSGIADGTITSYIEPFIGGGAFFFNLAMKNGFDECHLVDINEELILVYTVIRQDVEALIEQLDSLKKEYTVLDEDKRQALFYEIRSRFNKEKSSFNYRNFSDAWIARAADLIFLNRTCFNGLFRVNSKGEFNVPFGRYKNPLISQPDLLRLDSTLLNNTTLHTGDFTLVREYITEHSFVYFDPPYRPLNKSSFFTSYAKDGFLDEDQRRLAAFFRECDELGACCMLSNSDPKNHDPGDDFFDLLYDGFTIERVLASRRINSNGAGRGKIHEIIVRNY
ncbi:DNA adenine methylase [Methanocalculus sp.]|uniref:DNA adenine methylase n=1 Tax=Methanocalculus sp. TaxID=2004547 RepID=UPI002727AEE1|nr:DNA adenine methylase [Methanocalculus sp.]MDO8842560.1 DNA adenine methylase [Methanocalculus sp.]